MVCVVLEGIFHEWAPVYSGISAVKKFKFPRTSPSHQPLAKERGNSGYEIDVSHKHCYVVNCHETKIIIISYYTFTALSIAGEAKRTWTTGNCFAFLGTSHIGITRIFGAIPDDYITISPSKAHFAPARIIIHKVYTGP